VLVLNLFDEFQFTLDLDNHGKENASRRNPPTTAQVY
jgi:hypothetical protein